MVHTNVCMYIRPLLSHTHNLSMFSQELLQSSELYISFGIGLVTVAIVYLCLKRADSVKPLPLPPGISSWTTINSWTILPMSKTWEKYNYWSQKYGETNYHIDIVLTP